MEDMCLAGEGSRGRGNDEDEFVVDKCSSLVAQRERRTHFRFSGRFSRISLGLNGLVVQTSILMETKALTTRKFRRRSRSPLSERSERCSLFFDVHCVLLC